MVELNKNTLTNIENRRQDAIEHALKSFKTKDYVENRKMVMQQIYEKFQNIYNLDSESESEKTLNVDLNLHQLERFKE